jgi:hypothetical protein
MWLPNLLATKTGRQAAFFLLYVTEGIPLGFTATAGLDAGLGQFYLALLPLIRRHGAGHGPPARVSPGSSMSPCRSIEHPAPPGLDRAKNDAGQAGEFTRGDWSGGGSFDRR